MPRRSVGITVKELSADRRERIERILRLFLVEVACKGKIRKIFIHPSENFPPPSTSLKEPIYAPSYFYNPINHPDPGFTFFTSLLYLPGAQTAPSNPLNTAVKAVVSTVAFLSGLVSLVKNVKDLIDDWKKNHPALVNPAQGKMKQPDAKNAISPVIKEK